MNTDLKHHDRNLAIFQGDDPGGILWQPRLEYWYKVNKAQGTIPCHLQDASLLEIYDYCYASVRYFTKPLDVRYINVQTSEQWETKHRLRRWWKTQKGTLTDVIHYDDWHSSAHNIEYKLKAPEDFEIIIFILQDEIWFWDQEAYQNDLQLVRKRGCPQFYFRRSPLIGLFIDHMGYEETIYTLYDHPQLIQHYIEAASEADNAIYKLLAKCPVQVFSLGENIDAAMEPPPIWRKYLVPYYNKRVDELHSAGKYVHIHIDGRMKPLLNYLQDCHWDGIEAATAVLQGDVTLKEIKHAIGDAVLLDGIPALYFLPDLYQEEELVECIRRVVELFYPRWILGIADTLPPDGDIERVRLVGELVQELI
jgi:hypothetical protein